MALALFLILGSAAWRVAGVYVPEMSNFAPLMALTFCGAVYFRDRRLWLVPFAARSAWSAAAMRSTKPMVFLSGR